MGLYEQKVESLKAKIVEMGQVIGDLALEGKIHEVVIIAQGPESYVVDTATLHGNSGSHPAVAKK